MNSTIDNTIETRQDGYSIGTNVAAPQSAQGLGPVGANSRGAHSSGATPNVTVEGKTSATVIIQRNPGLLSTSGGEAGHESQTRARNPRLGESSQQLLPRQAPPGNRLPRPM